MSAASRTYAAESSVPVARTREEIRALLETWGCSAMGWTDHFSDAAVELGFVWDPSIVGRYGKKAQTCPNKSRHPDHQWRLTCAPCNWKDGFPGGDGQLFKVKMRIASGTDPQKQRTAHRLLLLKIKADLNAAQAGLAKAEEVFLPWICDDKGNTVSDLVLPKIKAGYLALPKPGATGGGS